MAITAEHIEDWRGKDVRDPAGESLGKLQEVFVDVKTSTPLLLSVKSGRISRHAKLIPIEGSQVGPDYVRVPHDKATVDASPNADRDQPPGAVELDEIGKAYGLRFSEAVRLESATVLDERRAEAQAARERLEDAEAEAREKADAAADAESRSDGASEEAEQARRDAEEAAELARRARVDAERHDGDA